MSRKLSLVVSPTPFGLGGSVHSLNARDTTVAFDIVPAQINSCADIEEDELRVANELLVTPSSVQTTCGGCKILQVMVADDLLLAKRVDEDPTKGWAT